MVAALLSPQCETETITITTTGDRVLDRPLQEIGGKGLFTKEIDEALLDDEIDLAVHSMKDVPTELPPGIIIPTLLPRADARDALLSTGSASIVSLPKGARIGTSSLRRAVMLREALPGCEILPLRGNVTTRIEKLERGEFDAIILAAAGLIRLGLSHHIRELIPVSVMLPAVAQGVIGIACREEDAYTQALLAPLHHPETALTTRAERAFLRELEGSCRTPIAAHARVEGETLHLEGFLAEADGTHPRRSVLSGRAEDAEALGVRLAEKLRGLS
jgi:hydroxymethylbilane synthase